MDAGIPDDAVEVGRILGAWGVKGWIRIQPYSQDPQALFSSKRWYLLPPEAPAARPPSATRATAWPAQLKVVQAREQGDAVVAAVQDLDDRDAADALKGGRLFVARSSFPTAAEGEYYWVDLIGLAVHNREGQCLGQVTGLLETGSHCVLRVRPPDAPVSEPAERVERLIPFVDAYVDRVDLPGRRIDVDWGLDY